MTPDDLCQRLAAERFGIFTREEALGAGLNGRHLRRRVKAGRLEEMFPGVYRHPASPRTWEQKVRAAQAWAGKASVASGRTAAALWGLISAEPDTVEITSPRSLRSPDPLVLVRRGQLKRHEIRSRRGIQVTSPERTLLDLGRTVPRRALESALDEALSQRLTTLERVWTFLEGRGRRGRDGTGALRTVLMQLEETAGTDRFERLLFAALVSRSLPKPVPQHPVMVEGKTYYLDFAYPDARLGIEAHSFKHHSERDDWESDQVRHAALAGEGWTILYVTWRRLRDHPGLVARDIGKTLGLSVRPDDPRLDF